tara:strand:+ start:16516 stop:16965 length:450 start_codon:yes stop_codon:yes gene_type:complete
MAVQSTYSATLSAAVAGMVGNMVPATFISRTVEDAAGIAFGLAAAQGTEDYECSAFGSGDTAIIGIVARERDVDPATPSKFAQYENARIMTKGCVWVTASVAVNAGDPVYVIPATGAYAKTSASSAVLIANARWETSTTGEGLALVRLG